MNNALHFVGFRGDDYTLAVKVFGLPDFFHRYWDGRAKAEVMDGDTVVFARTKDWQKYLDNDPVVFSFDDSGVF